MDIDLNDDIGTDVLLADIGPVDQFDQVVENRSTFEWDLNVICDEPDIEPEPEPEILLERVSDNSGHSGILNIDLNAVCDDRGLEGEPEVEFGQRSREAEVADNGLVSPPAIGDDFYSIEEAYDFWRLYGFQSGFGVCKRTSHKKGDTVVAVRFQCTKFRAKRETVQDGEPFPERRRPSGNANCKVFLKIRYSELTGSWRVSKLDLDHNHELTPGSSFLIPAYRYITVSFLHLLQYWFITVIVLSGNCYSIIFQFLHSWFA